MSQATPEGKATVEVVAKKPGFFSSGFWHSFFTGDGSGPEVNASSTQALIGSVSSAVAKTNGTAVGPVDGLEDPAVREVIANTERDRNYGVGLVVAAATVQGVANTEHQVMSKREAVGVYIHNLLWGKIQDKASGKLLNRVVPLAAPETKTP